MKILPALFLLCGLSPATGLTAVLYFDTSTEFLLASGNVAFDSYEDLAGLDDPVDQIVRPGYTMTSIVTPSLPNVEDFGLQLYTFASGFGAFATDGDNYIVLQTDTDGILSFDFAAPVTAFGLSITDWESPTGVDATLTFSNELGDQFIVAAGALPNGNEMFFGIVSDTPFTHAEFLSTSPLEAYGIDGVYYTAVIPLPAPFLLMLGALASLGAIRKRARH